MEVEVQATLPVPSLLFLYFSQLSRLVNEGESLQHVVCVCCQQIVMYDRMVFEPPTLFSHPLKEKIVFT